ncbi:MAG: Gfo/Idh/MocA family oxidoreductase [Anaerolineae bacterium]|nr:Gfo/Idh/MocA family oxidoreductase [Anaerolineae bacterium]
MTAPDSQQPLRVGVVGLGWAGETAIKAFTGLPGVEVIAAADPRPEQREKISKNYEIAHLHAEYEELVARDDLDIVSVATPTFLHAPVTIAALEHGKHVLCEKPIARSVAEGEAMVKAAIDHQRVLQVVFNHRRRGDVQVLKAYIDQGGLGRIYHAKAMWMRRSGIPQLGGWFTTREMAGGGPLIDLGVHILDMGLYLLNEPEVVAVSAATYAEIGTQGRGGRGDQLAGGAFEVEDLATAFIRLSNGITLQLEVSWAVYGKHGDDFGVALFGTDGGAEIDVVRYSWQDTLRIFTDTGGVPAEIRPQVVRGEGHAGVAREFIDVIRSGNWADHVGREGLRRTQIVEACYQSAQQGREVALVDRAGQL